VRDVVIMLALHFWQTIVRLSELLKPIIIVSNVKLCVMVLVFPSCHDGLPTPSL